MASAQFPRKLQLISLRCANCFIAAQLTGWLRSVTLIFAPIFTLIFILIFTLIFFMGIIFCFKLLNFIIWRSTARSLSYMNRPNTQLDTTVLKLRGWL